MTAPDGFWHRLETGKIPMDADFFKGFNKDLHDPARWNAFYATQQAKNADLPKRAPPMPTIDGEWLFLDMMSASRNPDPWMFPALKNLKASGKYIVGALSNTVIFPPDHEFSRKDFLDDPVRSVFDVFISSAHVGLRKPDPAIYGLALKEVNGFAQDHAQEAKGKTLGWADGIRAEDVLFLDDIGENLKAAKKAGFQTIKVSLGKAFEAVDELERITGLSLAGNHPRIVTKPMVNRAPARI
jgi:FMN phosphatase YigB (HAD superfamily)